MRNLKLLLLSITTMFSFSCLVVDASKPITSLIPSQLIVCPTPKSVYPSNITSSSADIRWKGTGPTDYEVRIRIKISEGVFGDWSPWASYSGSPINLHSFSGLDPNSFYHYNIKSVCGDENSATVSGWFVTE